MYVQDTGNRSADDERLALRLAYQSRRIERLFAQHRVAGEIVGGTVQRDSTSFQIRDYLLDGIERLRELAQELPRRLGVDTVEVSQDRGLLQLSLLDADQIGVPLLDLLPFAPKDSSISSILGIAEDGRLVCLDTSGRDIPNVLLSGKRGSGKASLLRTMIVSLAMLNRQSSVQIALITCRTERAVSAYSMLEPLSYLPHMLSPVAYDLTDAADILQFLVGELKYRKEYQVQRPALVVIVDGIVELLEQGGRPIHEPVAYLVQHGQEAGIFVILSTERPDSDLLGEQLRSSLAVRILGRLDCERTANVAAGGSRLPAIHLSGFGDFAAVVNGSTMTWFQSAGVADHDLQYCINLLQRRASITLLARPFDEHDVTSGAVNVPGRAVTEQEARRFRFDGESVVLGDEGSGRLIVSSAEDLEPGDSLSTEELDQ